ncbi:MAG TPA: FAD-binding domain [Gemmatimonadaceae bacterium]|jgi:2-polyprenyl-6-methoxyphenol hydroxylase-like FAD-dependent oxidoreductase
MRIVINGIGVAGPALGYWLAKSGHDVVLVEQAPRLRAAGYVIDFWGIGYDIVERMSLIGDIRALGYQVREVRYVNRAGRKRGGFDVAVFWRLTNGRFTSVRRSDLSATMYRAIEPQVETIFGDSIASIDDQGDRVRVTFDHAPPRDVDLVIGADGLHSRVRRLVFGGDSEFEVSLGYHVAAFEVEGYRPRDDLVFISHDLPGRQISRFTLRDNRTMFLFIFRDEFMIAGEEPKSALRRIFADAGWEWPQIEKEVARASEIYFDTVSQIRMNRWTKGRVALVGDAGACVSLMAGEGTGLAIAEAYVLAGELHACQGDFATAFGRYEQRLMPFLQKKQQSAAKFAAAFAPRTSFGIGFRNAVTQVMRVPFVADWVIGRSLRDEITLPDYDLPTI